MAEILPSTGEHHPEPVQYPWDEWLDGQARLLKHGEDFAIFPYSFRMLAYKTAKRRGLKLTTAELGPTVLLQAYSQGQRRPVLPTPHARLANGKRDPNAPDRNKPTSIRAAAFCTICSARLTNASAEAAGRCLKGGRPSCP